ncbi:MAG: MFS transporter [Gemmatimonadales bacterium]
MLRAPVKRYVVPPSLRRLARDIVGWRPLRPEKAISAERLERGLAVLRADGVATQVMTALVTSPFLVAFALSLGASNLTIGLLVALPPVSQILQLPAVGLVDYAMLRKALAVYAAAFGRLCLLAAGPLVLVAPPGWRLPVLGLALAIHYAASGLVGCAYNPWIRDLIPTDRRSGYLGRRLAVATAVAIAVSLAAAYSITWYRRGGGAPLTAHAAVFALGALAGLVGVVLLSRVPEPAMRPLRRRPLRDVLIVPLRDAGFRALLAFLAAWNFAATMASPFFAVYMLQVMHLPMATVVALTVVSQLATVLFYRVWGVLADRYGNRPVLQFSGPLFMASLLLWPFTMTPDATALTMPLLVTIHLLVGISTAGVTLCTSAIALKNAAPGYATAYLATNALVAGAAAIVAPLVGGLSADFLATQQVSVILRWVSTLGQGESLDVPALELGGLDFLFLGAFFVGLYAMHRLALVREEGVVVPRIAAPALYAEVGKALAEMSALPGLRQLTTFPYGLLRFVRERRRRPRS